MTLGFKVEPWEKIGYTRWKSVGAFEATVFDPLTWKETHPYEPIRKAQPADDYWAAKILGALTHEHIQALVTAARYPEASAAEYMVRTLQTRRHKVLDAFFSRVSPIEFLSLDETTLGLEDVARVLLDDDDTTRYRVDIRDAKGRSLLQTLVLTSTTPEFSVSVPSEIRSSDVDYVRVDVLVEREGRTAPRAAQFHLRRSPAGSFHLIGIVH